MGVGVEGVVPWPREKVTEALMRVWGRDSDKEDGPDTVLFSYKMYALCEIYWEIEASKIHGKMSFLVNATWKWCDIY